MYIKKYYHNVLVGQTALNELAFSQFFISIFVDAPEYVADTLFRWIFLFALAFELIHGFDHLEKFYVVYEAILVGILNLINAV